MISGILLDLSGVVYTGDQPLEGAIAAIERLREADLPLRFITNTTRTPKRGLLERLHKMGVEVKPGELFTPAEAACNWLTENQRSPHLLIHPDLLEDFEGLGPIFVEDPSSSKEFKGAQPSCLAALNPRSNVASWHFSTISLVSQTQQYTMLNIVALSA